MCMRLHARVHMCERERENMCLFSVFARCRAVVFVFVCRCELVCGCFLVCAYVFILLLRSV